MRPFLVFAVLMSACAGPESTWVEPDWQRTVYGTDDRLDPYDAPPAARQVSQSVAAMFRPNYLTDNQDGTWTVDTFWSLGDYYDLCPGEAFEDQPISSDCTGFFVGEDLFATAGHCVSDNTCPSTRFAFNFRMIDPNTPRTILDDDEVYQCTEVIARENSWTDDWAVVRVDRVVTGRQPVVLRSSGAVSRNTPLGVIGHPLGLPVKIAAGATVRQTQPAKWFGANLDIFAGNSGSPAFNLNTGEVEGVVARGMADFRRVGNCRIVNECSDDGCGPGGYMTEVSRATQFSAIVEAELAP